jgi:hypothetical protein
MPPLFERTSYPDIYYLDAIENKLKPSCTTLPLILGPSQHFSIIYRSLTVGPALYLGNCLRPNLLQEQTVPEFKDP